MYNVVTNEMNIPSAEDQKKRVPGKTKGNTHRAEVGLMLTIGEHPVLNWENTTHEGYTF